MALLLPGAQLTCVPGSKYDFESLFIYALNFVFPLHLYGLNEARSQRRALALREALRC